MRKDTYGLNPGALAMLKQHAKITDKSIVIRATTASKKLCTYLYNQIKTRIPVFLLEEKEMTKAKGPHGSETFKTTKAFDLISMKR